ncbi:MAG: lactate racemase domain-containing protein [Planctomycetes bacterium]|nr:lactate racemase domain-containing protein [Planctomycetota bacterium]
MSVIELPVGTSMWSFELPAERLVTVAPRVSGPPITDPRLAVRLALDNPIGFDHPLSRAMTPDDRVVLVIDEQLPHLAELVTGTLEYLAFCGIGPEAVTILTESGTGQSDWIEKLPDELADVHTEVHQPGDRKLMSYLGATKQGRRIYMNRTLVDADLIVCLSGRRYDPFLGYAGCEGSLYPALGDTETRQILGSQTNIEAPTREPTGARAESAEIAWMLGSPVYIQVIEGAGDNIANVVAGLITSSMAGVDLLDARWKFSIPEEVDVVVTTLSGDPARHDFTAIAQAALVASRAVKEGGAIVILSEAEPTPGEGFELFRRVEAPMKAPRLLLEKKPADLPAAFAWIGAAEKAHLYLASGLRPDYVEQIFATPLLSPVELQRLVEKAGSVLVLVDGHKSLVAVG